MTLKLEVRKINFMKQDRLGVGVGVEVQDTPQAELAVPTQVLVDGEEVEGEDMVHHPSLEEKRERETRLATRPPRNE
jgi:hypothetical protein